MYVSPGKRIFDNLKVFFSIPSESRNGSEGPEIDGLFPAKTLKPYMHYYGAWYNLSGVKFPG